MRRLARSSYRSREMWARRIDASLRSIPFSVKVSTVYSIGARTFNSNLDQQDFILAARVLSLKSTAKCNLPSGAKGTPNACQFFGAVSRRICVCSFAIFTRSFRGETRVASPPVTSSTSSANHIERLDLAEPCCPLPDRFRTDGLAFSLG